MGELRVENTSHSRRFATAALFLSVFLGAGCETITQDLQGVTQIINPTSPREAAQMMVDPHDADNRRQGTVLISNAPWGGGEVYVRQYRDMVLNERDPIVKATAIRALARHGQPDDALRIAPHLTHDNVQVRWEAAKGLQRLHEPAVVPDLLNTLRDDRGVEHPDVRVAAAIALGQYAEDRVVQGLIAALRTRELAINMAAEQSLHTLTGQTFQMDANQWLKWYNPAALAGKAFEGKLEYVYPTYSREERFLEKLAFWSSLNFETPSQPAGLRPRDERSTYRDENAPDGS